MGYIFWSEGSILITLSWRLNKQDKAHETNTFNEEKVERGDIFFEARTRSS